MLKQIHNFERQAAARCRNICLPAMALLMLAIALETDARAQSPAPRIAFTQTEYDYGTIVQHDSGLCTFTFKNTGDAPLVIYGVSTSCGCATPKFDARPLMPGKTGRVTVRYNTSKLGQFRKAIVVKSNASNQSTSVLFIKGFVKKKRSNGQN